MSMESLPCSSDRRNSHIHGASEYSQLGTPAMEALFVAAMKGSELDKVGKIPKKTRGHLNTNSVM